MFVDLFGGLQSGCSDSINQLQSPWAWEIWYSWTMPGIPSSTSEN